MGLGVKSQKTCFVLERCERLIYSLDTLRFLHHCNSHEKFSIFPFFDRCKVDLRTLKKQQVSSVPHLHMFQEKNAVKTGPFLK